VPIDLDGLGDTEPQTYTLRNVFRRLGHKRDPWSADGVAGQSLDAALRRLDDIED